ncbi:MULTISPECIES: RNA-binding protein [Aerococcus]|uniref:S4 domain-containing protein YlmH n=1 Tax=Aerococcus tenax TaxID=3078812 RepID=A0A5N1BSL7_9LACT|nr:YlmH/Sll1252 family protein [Aerococcus urinae]KAA9242776.1 S4 domain-containing protein YlmH [Aerococcus urinae]MDK6370967.1 YlmH/Sll1252 family protein [Aerococcus urinae]MDK6598022.1 YlmH/Sll1252 family protein [Aerococcus urinae]MDK7301826.1 YlmH/Sll1252 family protein [Aerococcus urinae]MDK7801222.1 YlmH/Sll1252 family protein [Aerococcus urinae]
MTDSTLMHFLPSEADFVDQVINWKNRVTASFQPFLSHFLDPREQAIVYSIIGKDEDLKVKDFGGYPQAEMRRMIIAPRYEKVNDSDFNISLIQINYAAKFNHIEHRQVLGTLLGEGLQKNRIGDIIHSDLDWQFFIDASLTDFVISQIQRIGKVSVKLEAIDFADRIQVEDPWQPLERSLASFRMDLVLSEGFNLSRSKVKSAIEAGLVKYNWMPLTNSAQTVSEGDILSLRHHGRLRLDKVLKVSKKGKYRVQLSRLENR